MEEADELCRADKKEDIAFEAADLLYFALTKCVVSGIGIAEIEQSLDAKARKVLGGIVWKEGDELPRHVKIPDLRPLGFKVLRVKPYRVVRLGGKTFKEGQLEALIEDAIDKVRMKEINKKKEAVKTGEPAVN